MAKNTSASNDYRYNNTHMFSVRESYKTIRTNIMLSVIKDGCKKIAVTSAGPCEGKSTISMNVAISLAQAFNKVLIMDCDLRRPRDHKAFHVANDPGISNVLSGLAESEDCIQETGYENLHILPAGIVAPNPSEMLSSQRMEALLEKLEKKYDYIILDTPPVNIVSDALSIVKYTDGVVFVVRNKFSQHSEVKKALGALEFAKAKVVGFVLNDVSGEKRRKYGSNYSDYSYSDDE